MLNQLSFHKQKINIKKVRCKTPLLISFSPVVIWPLKWWGNLSLEEVLKFNSLQGLYKDRQH